MIKSVTIKNRKTGQILFKVLERKNGKVEMKYFEMVGDGRFEFDIRDDAEHFDFDIRDENNCKLNVQDLVKQQGFL